MVGPAKSSGRYCASARVEPAATATTVTTAFARSGYLNRRYFRLGLWLMLQT